jgi:hypothetical protein
MSKQLLEIFATITILAGDFICITWLNDQWGLDANWTRPIIVVLSLLLISEIILRRHSRGIALKYLRSIRDKFSFSLGLTLFFVLSGLPIRIGSESIVTDLIFLIFGFAAMIITIYFGGTKNLRGIFKERL